MLGTDNKLESYIFKKVVLEKDIIKRALDLQRREGILHQWLFLIVMSSRLLLPDSMFWAITFKVIY